MSAGWNPWPDSTSVKAFFHQRSSPLTEIEKTLAKTGIKSISLKQVHGNLVRVASKAEIPNLDGSVGDGLVTSLPDLALMVHTADCLPLLGFEGSVIGACHGGWRGISQDVIGKWVSTMVRLGARVSSMRVSIGPAIGPCHFEVGSDVAEILSGIGSGRSVILPHENPEKKYIDLKELAVARLEQLGVRRERISLSPECTFCDEKKYFSYRRDGARAGRLEACIYKISPRSK